MTGRLPFEGDVLGDIVLKVCAAPMPVPSKLDANVPPGFDAWFARACSRDPTQRFQTPAELAKALGGVCGVGRMRMATLDEDQVQYVLRSTPTAAELDAGLPPPAPMSPRTALLAGLVLGHRDDGRPARLPRLARRSAAAHAALRRRRTRRPDRTRPWRRLGGQAAPAARRAFRRSSGRVCPRARPEQEERVVHLGVVRGRARAVEARPVEGERVGGVELVPDGVLEIRIGLLDGNGVEALDARLSLHACPFVARFVAEAMSLKPPDERKDEGERDGPR